MTKFPIIPIDINKPVVADSVSSETELDTIEAKYSQYFLQTSPPDVATVASSVNIRLPLFDTSKNYQAGMFSLERLYRDGTSDDVADFVVKTGAINKALKNAMLYNYFG